MKRMILILITLVLLMNVMFVLSVWAETESRNGVEMMEVTIMKAEYIADEGISIRWTCSNDSCNNYRIEVSSKDGLIICEYAYENGFSSSQDFLLPYEYLCRDILPVEEYRVLVEGIAGGNLISDKDMTVIAKGDAAIVFVNEDRKETNYAALDSVPDITDFSVSSIAEVGESYSIAGIVNGNGCTITDVSVAVRNTSDESLGGYWSRESGLCASSYDLSSIRTLNAGEAIGNTKLSAGSYIVQVYVTTQEGRSFEREYISKIIVTEDGRDTLDVQNADTDDVLLGSLAAPILASNSIVNIKVNEHATIDWYGVDGAERYALIVYDKDWKPLRTVNGYPFAELTNAYTSVYTYRFETCGTYYVLLYAQAGIHDGVSSVQSDAVTVTINVGHEWIPSGTSIAGSGKWKACTKDRDTYCCYQASVKYYKKCAVCGTLSDKSLCDEVSYTEDNASKSSHNYRDVSSDEAYRIYDEAEHIMITNINRKCSGCGKTITETLESEYRAAHVYDSDYICRAKGCGYKLFQNSVITPEKLHDFAGTYNPGLAEELANIAQESYSQNYDTGKTQEATTLAQNGFKNITYIDVSLYASSFFESDYVGDIFDVEATVAIKEEDENSIISVSFQGTSETTDWLVDAMASAQLAGIHDGFNAQIIEFLKATESIYFDTADGRKTIRELINEAKSGNDSISFVITGHSMGAADAQVLTYYLLNAGVPDSAITTYTFASPIPFLKEYIDPEMYAGATIYNIINMNDIVPMVGVAIDTPMDSSVTDTLATVLRVAEDISNGKYDVDYVMENMLFEIVGISRLYDMLMVSVENILAEKSGYSEIARNIGENVYFTTDVSSTEAIRKGLDYIAGLGDSLREEFVLRLLVSPGGFAGALTSTAEAMKDDLGSEGVDILNALANAITYNHKPSTYIDNAKTAK